MQVIARLAELQNFELYHTHPGPPSVAADVVDGKIIGQRNNGDGVANKRGNSINCDKKRIHSYVRKT
jgi:hypothetical protein